MELDLFLTPGLGDNSYLLSSGDEAASIDPQRDIGRSMAAAEARHVRIRYVLETHVHNDYVSGAFEIRAATGAGIVGPADARYAFPCTRLEDGAEILVGDVRLTALATPGHTPEHTAYVAHESGTSEPVAVFSGGSLLVGSAGRTDLLGPERTDELTRSQFRTVRALASLPDAVQLLPTHGAGSFCASTVPNEDRTSTIGRERATNPAIAAADEETFVREQLAGLVAYPRYYAHMAPINRAGPTVFGTVPMPPALTADESARLVEAGVWAVDGRDGPTFASEHVPGSLNVPLDESFASYVGWLVPFGEPLVLIVPDGELVEAATQLFRIGYERIEGYLEGGVEAWRASGREVASYPVSDVGALVDEARAGGARVLDVRQRNEWNAGHLPGSRHCFVGDILARLSGLRGDGELVVACASGHRASIAASMLDRAGVPVRLIARDGVPAALRLLG